MSKYKVLVCREVWGTIEVEAKNEKEAIQKAENHDYDSEFDPNGEVGNEGFYGAVLIGEEEVK